MRPVRYVGAFVASLVLAGSVVLTLARLLTPGGHTWVLLTSFVPWALVGYALAAVVCGLLCWRATRRRMALVGLSVALVGMLSHAAWLAPSFAASSAPGDARLTVMSLNLQVGGADPDGVESVVRRVQPDLIVLEETTAEALERLEERGIGGASGDWPHEVVGTRAGVGGTVVLSRFRLVVDEGFSFGNGGRRMRVLAPQPFALTAVHATYPMFGVDRWARDFRALVDDARETKGPHLLVGDFNATLDHGPMRTLLDQGLSDAAEYAGSGWQPTWPRPGAPTVRGLSSPLELMAIDHVLMSHEFKAVSTDTHEVPDTDHLALVARLSLR